MRKTVISLLLVFATFFVIDVMTNSTVYAQDVWVYTVGEGPDEGREFYIKTETAQYVDSVSPNWENMRRFYLEVECVVKNKDGAKFNKEYNFDYDMETGTWISYDASSSSGYSIDDKYYPELRYIFEAAKKYANRTVKRNW